jgi:hypothetical protein
MPITRTRVGKVRPEALFRLRGGDPRPQWGAALTLSDPCVYPLACFDRANSLPYVLLSGVSPRMGCPRDGVRGTGRRRPQFGVVGGSWPCYPCAEQMIAQGTFLCTYTWCLVMKSARENQFFFAKTLGVLQINCQRAKFGLGPRY